MEKRIIIDRLVECRNKIGITKMEAAKRMNLSQPAYLRYESGDRTPSLQTLQIIANILHTSVEYLTGESDNPSPNFYIVSKQNDPKLFALIEYYKNADRATANRLFKYAKALTNSADNHI